MNKESIPAGFHEDDCDHCGYYGVYRETKDTGRCDACGRKRKFTLHESMEHIGKLFKSAMGFGKQCDHCGVKEGIRHSQDCPKYPKPATGGFVATPDKNELIVPLSSSGIKIIPPDAALVFIQRKGERLPTIYQDGKKLKGIRSIVIRAAHDDITTHEVEFLTGFTHD